jgi:hypothetical protein
MGQMGIQPFKREQLKKRVVELYQAGHTFRELSHMLKISHETARQMWLSTTIGDVSLTQIDTRSSVVGEG